MKVLRIRNHNIPSSLKMVQIYVYQLWLILYVGFTSPSDWLSVWWPSAL